MWIDDIDRRNIYLEQIENCSISKTQYPYKFNKTARRFRNDGIGEAIHFDGNFKCAYIFLCRPSDTAERYISNPSIYNESPSYNERLGSSSKSGTLHRACTQSSNKLNKCQQETVLNILFGDNIDG